jgi:hypothetical protein
MVSALAGMERRTPEPFPELAILDSGAQVSIFNDELFFDESTMQATSTVIQGIGNKKVVSRKGIVDIMVQCPETEQEVRWRFLALCCPSCPVNLIALSAIGDGKRQKLNFWNSRKGWNGEFTINSPDGKTHKMCAKEHPRMKGIVCVEVLGATHSLTVGAPKKPDKTDAQVRALPKEVRIRHQIGTRGRQREFSDYIGTYAASELLISRESDAKNGLTRSGCIDEDGIFGVVQIQERAGCTQGYGVNPHADSRHRSKHAHSYARSHVL